MNNLNKIVMVFILISKLSISFSFDSEELKWNCLKISKVYNEDICELVDYKTIPPTIIMKVNEFIKDKTTTKYIGDNITEVVTSIGSYATASVFYNNLTHVVSESIPDVIEVDVKRKLAVSANSEGVLLFDIFNKNTKKRILLEYKDLSHETAIPQQAINDIKFQREFVLIDYMDSKENRRIKKFSFK